MRVSDGTDTADATVTVTSAVTVTTGLHPRILATLGASLVDIVVTGGDAVFSRIPTDRVRDLPLQQGTTYTLLAPSGGTNLVSFNFIVNGACALTVVP